jgi:hypothetical protein
MHEEADSCPEEDHPYMVPVQCVSCEDDYAFVLDYNDGLLIPRDFDGLVDVCGHMPGFLGMLPYISKCPECYA